MNTARRTLTLLIALATVAALAGCRDTPLAVNVDANNQTPIAEAGEEQVFDFSGSPVEVTLDGRGSIDLDGTVVTYRWLSGDDAPDGGTGRGGVDPEDIATPTVLLGAGTWRFVLFVIDERGGVSRPDEVTIQVGSDVDPIVLDCVADAASAIAADCKMCVCDTDDACRDLFLACDEACWTFYTCTEQSCRQFTTDPADASALADCVRANCSEYFGGVGPWIPLEPCVRQDPCGTICSDSVQGLPL